VTSALKDKEWQEIFCLLAQRASAVILVPFEHEDRGLSYEILREFAQTLPHFKQEESQNRDSPFWQVAGNLSHAFQLASSDALQPQNKDGLICVSGSVAFVGHVMTHLHINPFALPVPGEPG
jgi:folylpolyglutamate synthase/dihydropteroate synthase